MGQISFADNAGAPQAGLDTAFSLSVITRHTAVDSLRVP